MVRKDADRNRKASAMSFDAEQLEGLRQPLKAFAMHLCSSTSTADDLVQTTYEKALRSSHTFEAGTNLQSWLFTILHNTFLSERRKYRREVPDPDDSLAKALPVEMDPSLGIEIKQTLDALEMLPSMHKEILMLVMDDYSYEQIADLQGVPVGTVKSRLNRARQKLAEAMDCTQES